MVKILEIELYNGPVLLRQLASVQIQTSAK